MSRARPSHPVIANSVFAQHLYQLMAIAHGTAAGARLESLDEHFSDEIRQRFDAAVADGIDTPEARYHRAEFFAACEMYNNQFGLTMDGVMIFWNLAFSHEISDEWWRFVREELTGSYLRHTRSP